MHILVRDKRTGEEDWIPLERAAELMGLEADIAELMGLEADIIDEALEVEGECEVENYIALEPDWW